MTIRRTLAATLTAAALLGGVTVAAATPAAAATPTAWHPQPGFTQNEYLYLQDVHGLSPAASARYTDRKLVNAGRYACQSKKTHHLGLQVGAVRSRIIKAINRDVNAHEFAGRQQQLAVNVVKSTKPFFGTGIC